MKTRLHVKLLSSLAITAVLICSLFAGMQLSVAEEFGDIEQTARAAAQAYVEEKQNDVTREGLLNAVNSALPEGVTATLAAKDFYIKHAVPGVKDNDTTSGFPLNIPGSDGAVAAIFEIAGQRYGFSHAFAHTVETININPENILVINNRSGVEGVTYTDGHISGITKPNVEKIVVNYTNGGASWSQPGRIMSSVDKEAVKNVKVVIFAVSSYLLAESLRGWESLRAVAYDDIVNDRPAELFSNETLSVFRDSKNLKYVKLPDVLKPQTYGSSHFISESTFNGCSSLENFKIPMIDRTGITINGGIEYRAFYNTAVREFIIPEFEPGVSVKTAGEVFHEPSYSGGIRNIHHYKDPMTFIRAAALAIAKLNEMMRTAAPAEFDASVLAGFAKQGITGSSDASTYRESLNYDVSDPVIDGVIRKAVFTISDDENEIPFEIVTSITTIESLDVGGTYNLEPEFSPAVTEYNVTVPNTVSSLPINYTLVPGATVSDTAPASGSSVALSVGLNKIEIPVNPSDGSEVVTYTINITRLADPGDAVNTVLAAAKAYVDEKQNDVTPWGLLEAVRAAVPGTTVNLAWEASALDGNPPGHFNYYEGGPSDFFIKHAVPGVKDEMKDGAARPAGDIPLDIPGSDGAVVAVFEVEGVRVGFAAVIPHKVETIVIDPAKIAIADTSNPDFVFDMANPDKPILTGYTGSSDIEKIIIPKRADSPPGTTVSSEMMEFDSASFAKVQNVKVVVIDEKITLRYRAFAQWNGLRAVQFTPSLDYSVFSAWRSAFDSCANLKYVRLPDGIRMAWGSPGITGYETAGSVFFGQQMFYNCVNLENLNIPRNNSSSAATLRYRSMRGTAIRDFFVPEKVDISEPSNQAFTDPKVSDGIRNMILYNQPMTFPRAAALAAAKVSELLRSSGSLDR